ncbi:UvrD-helicase domain-containing protein [Paenibacillus sp. IB182496]|uniref:UvrD-helicase domain-containing protein n=1 Tax=Paenibacillus sabuli TaxID=2772509 RepID=A0A927BWW7_9BACL|nr:RNA polymerase recycling motor HelD [Paenibacillus sabuli]MBD2847235.1 UvrD-helicase domain-containing protein [Paenibacillus sabuli]
MTISKAQWLAEQARVDEVTGKIARRIARLEERTGDVRSDVVEIRKHFWDEVTINFSHAEDLTETYFSMKQQADVLSERERSHRHASAELGKFRRLVKSPYFGRIDFKAEEDEVASSIYLGIASFLDEQSDEFLVYDWRAPISSLYYDYGPGPVGYETPSGRMAGEMALKRQFVIRDGRIELLFDSGVTIGDELLQQALSRSSDTQMRNIVATIQKEQNRIIRDERARLLVVQGAAGSGKTSAALQRVAYLLYKHRESLQADQLVLFSPNPLFNSYVQAVLPELGEENMEQTTFQDYLAHRLGNAFELEDPFDQMEYVLTQDAQDPLYASRLEAIRFKSSPAYLAMLDDYVDRLEQAGMRFRPLKFRGEAIVSARAMHERFYGMDRTIRLPVRIDLLRQWLLGQIKQFALDQEGKPWVEEEMELLSEADYQRAYQKLRKRRRSSNTPTFDDYDQERELLARVIVRERLKSARRRVQALRFIDLPSMYVQLFTALQQAGGASTSAYSLPPRWADICTMTRQRLAAGALAYEDAAPYLYLQERVQGFQTNTLIRHVFVDEAQDYSPFQLAFLKRLFPRARMTALGDLNQAIFAHASAYDAREPLRGLFAPEETEVIRLERSYRSTKPIVCFTRGMIPGGEEIEPFERDGSLPLVTLVDSEDSLRAQVIEQTRALQAEGNASIAIICKTAGHSEHVHRLIADALEAVLVGKETASFSEGIQVMPAYLAKGVEFDAVIVCDGSSEQYRLERERKLFYTACTRAMHELRIVCLGEPSPFIVDQEEDTYNIAYA